MPEQLRAYIVIMILTAPVLYVAKRLSLGLINNDEFSRIRSAWLLLTAVAFLSGNYWIYSLIAVFILIWVKGKTNNILSLYYGLLFVIPTFIVYIPGFGVFQLLFELSHTRFLAILLLLPAFVQTRSTSAAAARFNPLTDKLFFVYVFLIAVLASRFGGVTVWARELIYIFLDVVLPYMVFSRYVRNNELMVSLLMAFVIAALALSAIGIFEFAKKWLLYNALLSSWDIKIQYSSLLRDGMQRATGSAGQPIVLGFIMMVALGVYLYLYKFVSNKRYKSMGVMLLVVGLAAPISRGPWLGAAVMLLVFSMLDAKPLRQVTKISSAFLIVFVLLLAIPGGGRVISLLPFIGNTEEANVTYRNELIDKSIVVIKRNIFFGSVDYRETPELQSMIQGTGIADITNSYLSIALKSGVVGLGLFLLILITVLYLIWSAMRSVKFIRDDLYSMGRSLFAVMVGIMVVIGTVSSISTIPVIYWSFLGLGVAYSRLVRQELRTLSG